MWNVYPFKPKTFVLSLNGNKGFSTETHLQGLVVLPVGDIKLSGHVDKVITDQVGVSCQSFLNHTQS